MIQGLDSEALRRYAAARKQIDESADLICSISLILSLFEQWPDDRIAISPYALGKLNDLINRHACRILSELEDFASANEARDLLERLEKAGEE